MNWVQNWVYIQQKPDNQALLRRERQEWIDNKWILVNITAKLSGIYSG